MALDLRELSPANTAGRLNPCRHFGLTGATRCAVIGAIYKPANHRTPVCLGVSAPPIHYEHADRPRQLLSRLTGARLNRPE
jgi:hypothetical protein